MVNGKGRKKQICQQFSAKGKEENITGNQQYFITEALGRKLVGQQYNRQKDEEVQE
uniref:hypothetical protein n=1 Tax=Clostridium sp. NkU-1 TaxID=1095009 RepID=UPI003261B893